MADCENKIGPVGSKYRIWLRRIDTHRKIVDTNIWVGNTPGDGFSKISSGKTKNDECWAYVEFETWEDLLKAIGRVDLTLDGELVQEGGGSVSLTLDGELVQSGGESVSLALDGELVQEGSPEPTPVGLTLAGELTQE